MIPTTQRNTNRIGIGGGPDAVVVVLDTPPHHHLPEAGTGAIVAVTKAEVDQGPTAIGGGGPTVNIPLQGKDTHAHARTHTRHEHTYISSAQR